MSRGRGLRDGGGPSETGLERGREGLWEGPRVGWEGSKPGFEGGFEVVLSSVQR